MKTNLILSGIAQAITSRLPRLDSVSLASRIRVLGLTLLFLTTLGVGSAWGTEETAYTLTPANGSNNSYAGNCDIALTNNSKTITWYLEGNSQMQPWRIGVAKKTAAGSVTRSLYSKTAIAENITKVVVTHGSKSGLTAVTVTLRVYSTAAKAATGGDGDVSNVSVTYANNTTMTFNRPSGHNWTGRFYRFDYGLTWDYDKNNAQYVAFSSAVFKYDDTPSCSYNVTLSYDGDASGLHGSFVLKAGSASGSTIAEGGTTANCGSGTTSVVVVPTPDTHYHVASVSATNKTGTISGPDGDGNYTISYTQGSDISSTVTVGFEEDTKYTVTWMSNGSQHTTTQVYSGEKPTFPTNPSSCDGTSTAFYGWATATWTGKLDDVSSKTIYLSGDAMPAVSGAVTYHAVFAKESATAFEKITSADNIYVGQKIAIVSDKQDYILPSNFAATTAATHPNSNDSKLTVTSSQVWTITDIDEYGYYKLKNSTTQMGVNRTSGLTSGSAAVGNYSTVASWWAFNETTDFDYTVDDCFYMYNWATDTYYNFLENSGSSWLSYYAANITSGNKVWYAMKLYQPERGEYLTTCCTELGSINGSVSWTNPTTAVVKWDMIDHVSSWTLKYKEHSAGAWSTAYTSKTSSDSEISTLDSDDDDEDDTYYSTISSLSCNTNYDFQIIANPSSGYCDASETLENKNSGKYVITLTGGGDITGGVFTADPESECSGELVTLEAAPNTGYKFDYWEITETDSGDDIFSDITDYETTDDEILIEMPDVDITVNAVFSCVSTTVTVAPTTAAGNYGWRYTPGETIDLTCSTSGATPTGYQWQKYISSDWEDIDGATTARFQKSNCTSSDGGSYRCVVTTGTGCSFQSDGYFIRIFTFDGNYSGESWTKNAITWTGENTGTVTLSLDESSIYEFKVYDNDGKTFGNGTNNYIIQPVNWDCGTGNSNCRLFTGPEGDYTFTLNISHAGDNSPYVNVQVAYPSVTHPVEGYAYVTKWWDCYVHWWYSDGSDHPLTTWGYDPQITTNTTICGTDYWYFPVLNTYNKLIVKNNAGDATSGNTSGDQTTDSHSGMYLTHDGSWGWHDFTTYSITFAGNSNTGGSMTNVNGICPGTNRTLSENGYSKTGYHFNGWKTNVAITINTGGEDTNIAANGIVADEATIKSIGSNITLTAQWAPNTNTAYTVKHYKQKLDGTYPASPDDTDNLTGTTGASITPARKSYTGFTAPSGTTTTILADGSRVVEYQYSRNSYTLAWSLDGGSIDVAGTTAGSVKFEASLTAPTVSKTGYTFNAWSPAVPSTMPAANSTYTATWTANTNTAYTVKHYKQKLDGTYPASADDTDNLTGTTATSVTPARKSYTGFTAPSGTTTTILADGSRVVEYQYTRNKYNVAVASVGNVTITATPSGGSAIAESANANVYYGQSVTLANSSITSGYYWAGWKVTKQSDGTDVTASVVSTNTLTVPAYAINVSAGLYTNAIAWCDPDIEVTGDVHLTSTKDVYVHSTSTAGNLIEITSSDIGSATRMEVAYLNADAADAEVDKASSLFRFYNAAGSEAIDALDLDYEWGTSHSIRYTPSAYGVTNNYKLKLIFKRGDKVLKTVTHAIYGRSLPEEFVIASKKDGVWYALPNTIGSTLEDVTPVKITVDDATTPTEVSYAPSTAVYKGANRYRPAYNISSIRFTKNGSQWLTTSASNGQLSLGTAATPTESVENKQVWHLNSSDFSTYTLKMDPSQSPGNKQLGIYNGKMGMFASGNVGTSGQIYLLPIETKYTPVEITEDGWTGDAIGVIATTTANKMGIAQYGGTETDPVTLSSSGTSHVADFDGDIDFTELTGNTILLKWYDGSTLIGGSQVTVPSIILAGDKDDWSDFAYAPTLDDIVVLSKPMTVDDTHAKAKQIVMDKSGDNTGKLTIEPNMGLEVAGTVKVYNGSAFGATTAADLILESSSSEGNASLIFDNSNGDAATVQMYSKASVVGNTWNWQYVGTPFENEIPLYNYYGSWMYKWYNGGWSVVHGTDELEPFAGYCLTQESGTTHVMDGTLVATDGNDIEIDMAASTDMVIANSWTAPIYIGGFTAETFTSAPATIYLFNTGSATKESGGASEGTTEPGTYNTVPVNSGPYFGTEFIPSMQGFFVTTNGVGGKAGKITLKYDELVRPDGYRGSIVTGQMYAPRRENKPDVMKIWANGSEYSDRVVILAREDFSEGFDNGWDGAKLSFGNESPSVYVINEEGGYDAVSAIPEYEGTLVGFRAGSEDNVYTMTFEYNGDEVLYLNDLKAQMSAEIANGQTYTFSTEDGDSEVRFIISHNPIRRITTGVDEVVGGTKVRKIIINDKVYIIRKGRVYSVDGSLIK